MSRIKLTRSEQARINGAKSRGPRTAEGRARLAKAHLKHGLYAMNSTLLNIESKESYDHLLQSLRQFWQPRNAFEENYVAEITDCTWRIKRLALAATESTNTALARVRKMVDVRISYPAAIAQAEISGSGPNGAQTMLERRISSLRANRTRLIHEFRLLRGVDFMGVTQEPLKAREIRLGTDPEITPKNPAETQENPETNPEPAA